MNLYRCFTDSGAWLVYAPFSDQAIAKVEAVTGRARRIMGVRQWQITVGSVSARDPNEDHRR